MFEIGNKYPIDRLVNRLLKENTESVTESVKATHAQKLYRKGIDIAVIASCLDRTESEIEEYLSPILE